MLPGLSIILTLDTQSLHQVTAVVNSSVLACMCRHFSQHRTFAWSRKRRHMLKLFVLAVAVEAFFSGNPRLNCMLCLMYTSYKLQATTNVKHACISGPQQLAPRSSNSALLVSQVCARGMLRLLGTCPISMSGEPRTRTHLSNPGGLGMY